MRSASNGSATRFSFRGALTGIAAIAIAACGGSATAPQGSASPAGPPVTAKFAYFVAQDTSVGAGAAKFAELAAKYTGNSVHIQSYPSSELGSIPTVLQGVQAGTIQFAATTNLSTLVPGADVILLPYLFPSTNVAQSVLNGSQVQTALWDKFKAHDVQVMGVWSQGFADLLTNKKVTTPADVAGLRIRIFDPNVGGPMYSLLHANGVNMTPAQVFTALSTHAVDGIEDPPASIYGFKWQEQAKYLAITQHVYVSAPVIVSSKWLSSLTPAQRDGVERAFKESLSYQVSQATSDDSKAMGQLKSSGATVTQVDTASFKQATAPVYDQVRAKFPDLVDALTGAVAAAKK